ncbi:MAG: glycosyltransferase family 2 protein [Thermoguttaceae bacterium]
MKLSIVVPVYNEVDSLPELHREIDSVLKQEGYDAEIIYVDDGSTDQSWSAIERLADWDPRVRAIRFRRNFGKAAALKAGFSESTGDFVITMDADLQDDPAEIPGFLAMMDNDHDVISGWKKVRHDPWHKTFPSKFFNKMVSWISGTSLHDHNCGMKCYRREIFDEITLYGELHRFVPVLAASRGFKVGEKVIQHRARQFGSSKYGFNRFIKGFLDILTVKFVTGYGQRPQHLLGTLGLSSFAIGTLTLLYLAFRWGLSRLMYSAPEQLYNLHDRPAVLYGVALMLLGVQLLSIGIIAELFIAYHNRVSKDYSIKQRIGDRE